MTTSVELEDGEWQAVLTQLTLGPWHAVNPLILKIGTQLRLTQEARAAPARPGLHPAFNGGINAAREGPQPGGGEPQHFRDGETGPSAPAGGSGGLAPGQAKRRET